MRTPRVHRFLLLSTISLGLIACGDSKIASVPVSPVAPSPAQTPPTTLTGNWLLTGSRVPAAYPIISTTLYIQGNIVIGETSFSTQCTSNGFTGGSGSTLPINGTIANDGTFQASTGVLGSTTIGTVSLSLTGNSPLTTAPSIWTGTYSLTETPGSTASFCNVSQTATFVANSIASLTGTYVGVPVNTPTAFGSGAVVSVQITQGTPMLVPRGAASRYIIPLTASLTIANSPCPVSASTTGVPETSSISGDRFLLALTPGSPYGFLDGTLNDPSAKSFFADLTSLAIAKNCPGIASYNFTRT